MISSEIGLFKKLRPIPLLAIVCSVALTSGCAEIPQQTGGSQAAAGYGVPIDCNALQHGSSTGRPIQINGLGPLGGVVRQFQVSAQQALAQQRAAELKECAPHATSVLYSGSLTPVTDVRSIVNGKTLYLDTAIVANHQLVRMKEDVMFLAANGRSYSPVWTDQPWYISGNSVCITGKQASCMQMYVDAANELYMTAPPGLLLKLAHTESGDSAHVKEAYAENMKDKAKREAMAGAMLGIIFGAVMSGGGGGGGGVSSSKPDYYRLDEPSGSSTSYSPPSYTPPIGGERGLYGSDHSVD